VRVDVAAVAATGLQNIDPQTVDLELLAAKVEMRGSGKGRDMAVEMALQIGKRRVAARQVVERRKRPCELLGRRAAQKDLNRQERSVVIAPLQVVADRFRRLILSEGLGVAGRWPQMAPSLRACQPRTCAGRWRSASGTACPLQVLWPGYQVGQQKTSEC